MLADLFRALTVNANADREFLDALGFERDPSASLEKINSVSEVELKFATESSDSSRLNPQPITSGKTPQWDFPAYRVLWRESVKVDDPDELLAGVQPYKTSENSAPSDPPACRNLIVKDTLTLQLRRLLQSVVDTQTVDTLELVNRVARYRPIEPLPKLARPRSGQDYWLLVDELPGLIIDIDYLWRLVPTLPSDIRPSRSIRLISSLAPRWLDERDSIQPISGLPVPPIDARFLILSDKRNPSSLCKEVLQKWCMRAGQAKWLSPSEYIGSGYLGEPGVELTEGRTVERLLGLLYPYPGFTRAMVRECRLAINGPASAEIDFWQHSDVARDTADCEAGEVVANHKEHGLSLERWHNESPKTVRQLIVSMEPHLNALPVWYKSVACLSFPEGIATSEEIAKASDLVASLSSRLEQRNDRRLARHLSSVVLSIPKRLQTEPPAIVKAAIGGTQQWWKHISPEAAARAGLPQHAMEGAPSTMALHPDSCGLKVSKEKPTCDLIRFGIQGDYFFADHGDIRKRLTTGSVINQSPVTLHTADEKIELDFPNSTNFHWAESLEQNQSGLTLTTSQQLKIHYPAEAATGSIPQIDSSNAPEWLDKEAIRIDEYGLSATLNIFGVEQIMRWIPPGRFMMGSAEDEDGRFDRETLHEVILTEGYWLANTPCTQQFWQSVMGDNPSEFKGDNLPVDSVSWDEVQRFIEKVNAEHPALNLGLPTEAQWEYACRAGTLTPFSVGQHLDEGQANFEGKFGQTTEVGRFSTNPWGLFDMHGNVWEWCDDLYGPYSDGVAVNPAGVETGVLRVLRGGGWFVSVGRCRSAYRNRNEPSGRSDFIGFRFAQVDQPQHAKRQPAGEETKQARRSRKSRAVSDGMPGAVKKFFRGEDS